MPLCVLYEDINAEFFWQPPGTEKCVGTLCSVHSYTDSANLCQEG
jgi:hypothetical protein